MRKRTVGIIAGALSVIMLLSQMSVMAQENDTDEKASTEQSQQAKPQTAEPKFTLSDELKATVVNLGDFEAEKFSENFSAKLDTLISYGMNGVYINPYDKKVSYFTTNMNKDSDRLEKALAVATKKGMQRFVYFDVNRAMSACPEGEDKYDFLVSEAHKFALRYRCNGIILTGFYGSNNNAVYDEYMKKGSGIGYKNWLFDSVEYKFATVSEVIHLSDNSIAVGLDAKDVWANSSRNEKGSDTSAKYSAYYNGYADTKTFVEKGLADFIVANASGSLDDAVVGFDEVCSWWSDVAKTADIPLYIVHHNEKIGTDEAGWGIEDQLLKQLAKADELDNYSGSVFYSEKSLEDNPMGTTDTLTKYFNEQINVDSLFEDLEMTSPYYTNYSTDDTSVAFMGTFDENFDVYFDGEKLTLNEAGNFYFEKQLEVGMNTFVITHKGKTINYNIERTINVLKSVGSSVSEGKTLSVDGGTSVSILAVAYKGSYATATLGGTTIELTENAKSDVVDINSSYAAFTGKITVPEGIVDEEQYLGNIEISASYAGYSRTYIGAEVTVNAVKLPEKNVEIIDEIPADQSSFGDSEVVGKLSPAISEDTDVTYVKLNKNFAYIYDGNNTDSVNPPNVGQLPEGTLDYYKSEWDDYYVTASGKRFLKEDADLVSGVGMGENPLVVKAIGNSGGDSFIQMSLEDRSSFTVTPIGNEYYTGVDGDFNLDDFTAQYIYVTFDNVTSVTSLPDFDNCTVFSAGEWQQVEVDGVMKFRLVLKLRQPGVYAGNSATYDSDGNLMFKFEILTNDITNMTIVIDPGHGVSEYGYDDPGAIGHIEEAGANLAVAKLVEAKLKELGVNVVRLNTESEFYDTMRRPYFARDYGCDLYIAIHSNKAGSEDARGTECYYYTSYSQPLAESLTRHVSSYFSNSVYSDGADCNRGAQYSYMWTTKQQDFPSVLIEMGFVSNYEDAMALANSTDQDGIAQAIVDGIQEYVTRSGVYSY